MAIDPGGTSGPRSYRDGVIDTLIQRHDRDMAEFRAEVRQALQQYQSDNRLQLQELRQDLLARMQEMKNELRPVAKSLWTIEGKIAVGVLVIAWLIALWSAFVKK